MDGNIHFYCINLKHRTDRWEAFSSQLAVTQIQERYPFERFDAVLGKTIDIQSDPRVSLRTKRNIKEDSRRNHEDLNSLGGVGCYLSHAGVWQKIAEGKEPYAIVFEDDTELEPDFLQTLDRCMLDREFLPEMPDLWTFSYGWKFYYKTRGKKAPEDVPANHSGPWVYNTCPGGTNGYFLTREGAKKLLAEAFPIDMHVDLYMCACVELKKIICVSHNSLILGIIEEVSESDIQLSSECLICNIPNNYTKYGIISLNVPLLAVGICTVFLLSYLSRLKRR